jgi:hypothetical protein
VTPTTPTQVAEERIARLRAKARESAADVSDRDDAPEERAKRSTVTRAVTRAQKRSIASP